MPPRILALETSDLRGSVAALDGERLLVERPLDPTMRSAQSLAPAIRAVLAEVGWRPKQVERIGVTTGPGSFTGLRVGLTTAKTFAYAVGAEVVGVDTLSAIALQAPPEAGPLHVAVDAHRRELFTAEYGSDASAASQLETIDAWLAKLSALVASGQTPWVTGPALVALEGRLPPGLRLVLREAWVPRAASVGRLAAEVATGVRGPELWALVPTYLRASAAEEKLTATKPSAL
jgi:tRNA threonylcarbamoyladenosine biosynthesis protein TsaB